jgi:hypothetical protein
MLPKPMLTAACSRSWTWFTCNEVGFFQDAAPTTSPTLVSRLVQPAGDLVRRVELLDSLRAYELTSKASMFLLLPAAR